MKLRLSPDWKSLPIWDTPGPPTNCCRFTGGAPDARWRFRTASLDSIKGITFLYCWGKLYAIYAHRSARSCALDRHQQLSRGCQRSSVWIYLPRASSDRITVLGTREAGFERGILVGRTKSFTESSAADTWSRSGRNYVETSF